MSDELPPIERLQAVALEPGDVLVVTLAGQVRVEEAHAAKAAIGRLFPANEVLVMDSRSSLEVMRP